MKFQVGDRVAVYDFFDGKPQRLLCTVHSLGVTSEIVLVETDENKFYYAHAKQCRKLVKKPKVSSRRRVWINITPDAAMGCAWMSESRAREVAYSYDETVEFVEVRRKKNAQ